MQEDSLFLTWKPKSMKENLISYIKLKKLLDYVQEIGHETKKEENLHMVNWTNQRF